MNVGDLRGRFEGRFFTYPPAFSIGNGTYNNEQFRFNYYQFLVKKVWLTDKMNMMADGTRPRSLRVLLYSSAVNGLWWTVDARLKLENGSCMFCWICWRTSVNVVSAGNLAIVEEPLGTRNLSLDILLQGEKKWW